ncbi:CREB-regulated transcription coactivator 1-like isoform X2 [Chrysoperla carnea]|uniref:CREB-regulated transcription coactivator 1-like isoform X2 n=1 Tax=Chrysoperla carnea TaxID=189513 RepID=UPI001D07586C|nr:CREB-regulated transcription coactivator 1-like isoform X2 [Chrysoperla carnea]
MANPRKFSEKIALHNQKQAEETAAFEQIMREVSDATAKPDENNPLTQIGLNTQTNVETVKTNATQRESRGRSVGGGPIRSRPIERKMDTSPYSSGPYLSPPPDTSWRRTNSDSALHQSAMQLAGECSNLQRRHADSIGSRWSITQRSPSSPSHENHHHHQQHHHHHHYEQRPRSSCDVPRVPGINIYPSAHEPGTVQIPIGNNTGSLPDLTNVHFPIPLNNPLDNEQDQSSSPYSSSPVSASPATLSPTSLPTRQPSARFQFSPGTPGARASSPITSTHQGITLDNTLTNIADYQQQQSQQYQVNSIPNIYQQQQCSPPSPIANTPTYENSIWDQPQINRHPAQMGPNTGYRSPQTRPSPQSSPGVTADGARHSAPCSPSAPHSPLPSDNYIYNQTALLQQQFEVCSMVDNPNPVVTSNYNIETSNASNTHFTQANSDLTNIVTSELGDGGYFSTSPSLPYTNAPTSLHTTPNTPTSIPDIILTDFSNPGDDLCRAELSKELGSAITGTLDTDFFPSDESLREGLGPLDFDGLQMLTDPELNVISDYTEDHFRQDRL